MSRTSRTGQFSGEILNKIQIKLPALSVNEGMARAAVAAFVSQLDPGVTEIADIKCAVSEAVTNAIVHGYRDTPETGSITVTVSILAGRAVKIEIKDKGCGIADVAQARVPMFTTGGEERSGMGITIMESFMSEFRIVSKVGKGTTVHMRRKIVHRGGKK